MTATARTLTVFELVDQLIDRTADLIFEKNPDRGFTAAEFAGAFERTFAVIWPVFLEKVEKSDPTKAAQLRTAVQNVLAEGIDQFI